MNMNLEAGSFISSRLVNSSQKREIMWNIIDPGDPYDIRKSMIARLPGRKNFMGDHLELVCLLQAAEIQRLCEYLQQYKLKFREIERKQLDRHSYEIQIKELSQQLSQDGSFRVQNLKLKEFLRKQTTQFEELKKRLTGFDSQLGRKYEDSLRQIEALLQENQILKTSSSKMRVEFQQIINAKTVQSDDLQRRLREISSVRNSANEQKSQAYFKFQIEYKKLEFENKRIKEIIDSKNREIEELQGKSKQFIYQIQELTVQLNQHGNIGHTLAEYQNRFALLGQELDRLNLVLRQKTGQLNDITNKYRLSEEENRRKMQYIQQVQHKKEIIEENYRQLDLKFRQSISNMSGLDESKSLIKTYEFNLQKLSGEIQRLNNVLRKKVQELDDATRRIGQLDYEVRKNESVKKEVEDFRIKYSQFSKKIVEYQSKIALLSQELERLNNTLKRKTDQNNYLEQQMKNSQYEIENYQKRLQDLDVQYKVEINRLTQITRTYEININQLKQDADMARRTTVTSSSPSKNELLLEKQYQSQIQSLNQLITAKNAQIVRYQQQLGSGRVDQEKQRILQKFEIQINTLRAQQVQNRQVLAEYQRRIVSSTEEINRLNSLLRREPSPQKQDPVNLKKITQYENKLAIMNQEIERLNQSLRNKVNENKNLELRLRQYETDLQFSRKREIQGYLSSISELERKNASLVNQNKNLMQELRNTNEKIIRSNSEQKITYNANKQNEVKIRQLYDQNSQLNRKLSEFQYQITTLSNEIQRLNTVLKQKIDQIQSIQQKYRNSTRQAQQFRRRVTQYEYKITTITKEYQLQREGFSKNNQYELENTKRQCAELQRYNREYQIKINQYENQLRNLYQENDRTTGQLKDQKKRFSQYQNRIVVLSQEIQRLNQLLQKMNQDNTTYKKKVSQIQYLKTSIVTLEQKFSRAVQENDELRKGASELSVTKTRLNQEYEFKVRNLTQQNEQLVRNGKEMEYKLTTSSKEIQRLNNVLKGKVQDLNSLESKLRSAYQQSENQNRKIQQLVMANRKIAEYDNKISILSQEIERLNEVLRIKVDQINNYQSRCRNYEIQLSKYQRKIQDYQNSINRELSTKIAFLNKENQELKLRVKQLTNEVNKIPELESKFSMVYSEVQRLNNNLKLKMQEIVLLQNKTRNYEQEIQKYRRRNEEIETTMHRELKNQSSVFEQRVYQLTQQNDSLRKNLRELADSNRRIGQYQNRMNILSKEIERLNQLLVKYTKEIVPSLQEKLRNASYENEDLKRNLTDFNELNKSYQELITKYKIASQENQQYHRRVQEYEHRMNQISSQIERLNNVMRSKVQELNTSENKLRQAITEIENLNKKLRQFNQVNRKIPEMESHIALLSQQIERLNSLLKTKLEDNSSFQRELRRYKLEYQNLQRKNNDYDIQINEYKNNRSILEQKLSNMGHENQDLRKGIRQLTDSNRRIADYESRMALLSQQIERLNMNLRMKIQELSSLDTLFKNYKRESEVKLSNLASQLEEQKRRTVQNMGVQNNKISEYQNKLVILSQEIERLNYLLKEQTYQKQILHKKQPQYLGEIQRLNNTLRLKVQQTSRWEQANSELKARLKGLQDNLHLTSQEYQKLKHSHNTLTQEYNRVNKHLVEYQQSINKLYQQFERLQTMLQELRKENYEYKLKLQQSGNLIEMNRALSAQIDRLTIILKTQSKDLEDLRLALADQSALQKRISEDMALMVVLFAEIESLRKRVKQTEIEIETVRRSSLAPFKV